MTIVLSDSDLRNLIADHIGRNIGRQLGPEMVRFYYEDDDGIKRYAESVTAQIEIKAGE